VGLSVPSVASVGDLRPAAFLHRTSVRWSVTRPYLIKSPPGFSFQWTAMWVSEYC